MDETRVELVVTSPAEDPYEEFLKGQRKRQIVWNAQQAARRAKLVHPPMENSEMQKGENAKTGTFIVQANCHSPKTDRAHLFLYFVEEGTAFSSNSSSSQKVFGSLNLTDNAPSSLMVGRQLHNNNSSCM